MANPPQFAILNHAAVDSGIPREPAAQRIGISYAATYLAQRSSSPPVRDPGARRDRSSRGPAVLVRVRVAGRSAGPAGVSNGALSQVGAILTGHALAARRS